MTTTSGRKWSLGDDVVVVRGNLLSFYVVCLCCALTFGAQVSPSPSSSHDADRDRGLRHVHVDIINSTSITLRWSPPMTRSQGSASCSPQRYTIRLKQAGIRQSRTWKLEGDRQLVSLHDLQPGTEYQLRLMATMCDSQRKHSRWVKVTTPQLVETSLQEETEAPGQPTSVRVRTFVDSAVVTWLPPEDSILVRTYMIGYGEGVPDVKWIYVNGSQRNVTITNLKPSTQYVFSIRAMNNFGKGLVVYDLVYTRDAAPARFSVGGSLPAPTNLQSKVLTPTSINLQWTDPSLDAYQRITDERYYNVYYQAAPAGNNLSVIVKALHVTLPDLLPNRQYRFKVRTVKGSQTSPFSDIISNWTRMDTTQVGDVAPPSSRAGGQSTPPPNARPGAAAAPGGGGLMVDDDDYGEEWDEDDITTGHIDVLQQQGKTKRAHQSRPPSPPQPAMARTLINYPQSASLTNRTATSSSSASSTGSAQIQFRTHVQYRVSAYVMWPEHPAPCQQATQVGNDTQPSPSVGGYLFRYKAVDDEATSGGSSGSAGKVVGGNNEYIIRNLAANFVLLDNLMPGFKYRFQVRYVFDKGEPSAWSQEAVLDTSYNPSRP